MEICSRCKINKAEIKCNECKVKYCKLCDYFLHVIMNGEVHNKNKNNLKKTENKSTFKKETKKNEIKKNNKTSNSSISGDYNNLNNNNNSFKFNNYHAGSLNSIIKENLNLKSKTCKNKENNKSKENSKSKENNENKDNNKSDLNEKGNTINKIINIKDSSNMNNKDNNDNIKFNNIRDAIENENKNKNKNKYVNQLDMEPKYNFEYHNRYAKASNDFLSKINELIDKDKKNETNNNNNTNFNLNRFNTLNNIEERITNITSNNPIIQNPNLNSNNYNYTFTTTNDNNDIYKLQKIIETQRTKINELKLELNNLKCIIDKKELLIKKLNSDIEFMSNKFVSIQECQRIEKEEINNAFNTEKEKIIKEYEEYIENLNKMYNDK